MSKKLLFFMIGIGIEKDCSYVGVSSRSELFDAAVGTNVFNDIAERSFVLFGATTTARLLFATFGLHYNIHASETQNFKYNFNHFLQTNKLSKQTKTNLEYPNKIF